MADVDRSRDCALVPYSGVALCYAWEGDNHGPPSGGAAQVNAYFDGVEAAFPDATVVASDAFDDFVADVLPFVHTLPTVTAEIGDTWIMGANSDPAKVAKFRAASRARARCAAASRCGEDVEPGIRAFDRLLLKVAEHTWGWNDGPLRTPRLPAQNLPSPQRDPEQSLDPQCTDHQRANTSCEKGAFDRINTTSAAQCCAACAMIPKCAVWEFQPTADPRHPGNCHFKVATGPIVPQSGTICGSKAPPPGPPNPPPPPPQRWVGSYNNTYLAHMVATDPEYKSGIQTWVEQRAFVANAVAALTAHGGTSKLAADIEAEYAALAPTPFNTTGYVDVANLTRIFQCGAIQIGFGTDGAIAVLVGARGHVWADGGAHRLGRLWYNGLDAEDEAAYLGQYLANWKFTNFGKPNLNQTKMDAPATLIRLQYRAGPTPSFLLTLAFPTQVHALRGAPASVEVLVMVNRGDSAGAATVDYTVQWRNKTACHVPETLWFSNNPTTPVNGSWAVDKLGSPVNPLDANLTTTGIGPHLAPDGANGTCGATGVGPSGQLTCGVNLHAVGDGGASFTGDQGEESITIASTDVALVAVGEATPFPQVSGPPDPTKGIHFAMVGNIWNTNCEHFSVMPLLHC